MRVEHLFSKLESRTSLTLSKISNAAAEGQEHIDILEKDIHILFKFMNLSLRRSEHYRDELESPYRENDFMFQELFETSKKRGRSATPSEFWLEQLLYLLQTSHQDILADAEKTDDNVAARTYKCFIDCYALQIWKAADGHEFFLNDRVIDFEGETQSYLGTEVKGSGPRLILMTTDDLIHLVLPISPDAAVIFCNESRCWESPFAGSMHRLKIPYPQNSLLKNAPHKDIIDIHVPSMKRGKRRWPATVAWRVNIGTLSRDHHQILTSYSLGHAKSFVIVRRRAPFERAKRESQAFHTKQAEVWKSQGIRFAYQETQRQRIEKGKLSPPSQEQSTRVIGDHICALEEMLSVINSSHEPLHRTKDNALKSWLAIRTLELYERKHIANPPTTSDTESSNIHAMHPALRAAFEVAYPPQPLDYRNLLTIDFGQFFSYGISEETFVQLTSKIDSKIADLVREDSFHTHWEACAGHSQAPEGSRLPNGESRTGQANRAEKDLLENPSFKSIVRAAQGFAVLKWMFEHRQDILATLVHQITVPMEAMQPRLTRIRLARE